MTLDEVFFSASRSIRDNAMRKSSTGLPCFAYLFEQVSLAASDWRPTAVRTVHLATCFMLRHKHSMAALFAISEAIVHASNSIAIQMRRVTSGRLHKSSKSVVSMIMILAKNRGSLFSTLVDGLERLWETHFYQGNFTMALAAQNSAFRDLSRSRKSH